MSWVTQKYKLISTDNGETFELYNLLNDPGESKNIIAENPELVEKMKTDFLACVESCKQSDKGADY